MKTEKSWRSVAIENGLAPTSYYKRIKKGMTPEEAATKPRKMDVIGTEKEKTCIKCQENKAVEFFYKRKSGVYDTKCKKCANIQSREWRKNNPEKHKAERMRNHDKYIESKRKWDCKNKEKLKILNRAHKNLHYAINTGKVIKANKCEFCEKENIPLDGAHHDYSKPLDVKWLCKSCHAKWDREKPKSKGVVENGS